MYYTIIYLILQLHTIKNMTYAHDKVDGYSLSNTAHPDIKDKVDTVLAIDGIAMHTNYFSNFEKDLNYSA